MELNLNFIDLNYWFLSAKITQLKTLGLKLSKTITEILETKRKTEEEFFRK